MGHQPAPDEQPHATTAATLHTALDLAAARAPDATVDFPNERETVSLRELADRSRTMAGALLTDGVAHGERVGILATNSADFLTALFAVSRAGAAASPLALPTAAGDLGGYASRLTRTSAAAGMRRVITGRRLSGVLARLGAGLGGLRLLPANELAAAGLATDAPGGGRLPEVGADDVAIVQFTSGSTALPKGVVLTHRNVLAGIRAIITGIRLGQGDHGGSWLPMYHDMGLFATLSAVMTGIDMTVWSPAAFIRDPARWLREFLDRGGTISPAPNFAYDQLVAAVEPDEVAGLDMRGWRVALNGAEPISPLSLERFLAHFAPAGFAPEQMFPVYGMAEATLAVTFPPLGRAPVVLWVDRDRLTADGAVVPVERDHPRARGLVGVGRPVLGVRVRVRAADGDGAPGGQGVLPAAAATGDGERVGEIEISGTPVTAGYVTAGGTPNATAAEDGWLRTGDLGLLRDGELYVTGRAKEMIIIRGVNYYPEDAEQAVRDLPGLHRRRAVAVGGPDGRPADGGPTSETGAAGVVMTLVGETSLTEPAARDRLAAELAATAAAALGLGRAEVAARLVDPGTLPRTSSGKFQRLAVRGLLDRGEL
ncbi:AMP-dependent synthetase [Pseudofrankia asymbiotica]|uniref:AMP-dependent synthetase n=1 Tax=Pseudofrankia asymbiotica TaxID=1834516 RepID=A0A1V2IEH1_9ACTN|nr:AMP-dependent synthetase [Pseudofrankia asymbiotica]